MVKLGRLRLPTRSNVKLSEERAHAVFSSCRVSDRVSEFPVAGFGAPSWDVRWAQLDPHVKPGGD
jgi:hypothetical protein